MKTITCRQMGGMCDEPITAATSDEMLANGMAHLEVAHPEMAADIKSMPADHPAIVKWGQSFKKTWEETPEN